jgi:hypothetical protein
MCIRFRANQYPQDDTGVSDVIGISGKDTEKPLVIERLSGNSP